MSCCNNIPCNPLADAEIINKSISEKMFHKNDSKSLINVIGRRTNAHMQRVREEYEKLYQIDLLKDIEKNVHWNFKKLLLGLVKSFTEYRSEEIYKATKGLITDKRVLIDFIIGNDSRSVEELKQFFKQKYEVTLVDFLRSETKGNFETVLVRAAETKRVEGIQDDRMETDVESLYQAGQGKFGTIEDTFSDILTARSYEHLYLVNSKYREKYNFTIKETIKEKTSGWFQKSLLGCLVPPQIYWAKRMRDAVKGVLTDDSLLVKCFSQCTKPMLQQIAVEYQKKYDRNLHTDVKSNSSGDYRELLMTILSFPENERAQYVL